LGRNGSFYRPCFPGHSPLLWAPAGAADRAVGRKCNLPGLFLFNPAKTYADKTAMMYEFFNEFCKVEVRHILFQKIRFTIF
jgi:hypothetical protein